MMSKWLISTGAFLIALLALSNAYTMNSFDLETSPFETYDHELDTYAGVDNDDGMAYEDDIGSLEEALTAHFAMNQFEFPRLDLSKEEDREHYKSFMADEKFQEFREEQYFFSHGISASEFDNRFTAARTSLLSLAKEADVKVDIYNQTFSEVVDIISENSILMSSNTFSNNFEKVLENIDIFDTLSNLEDPVLGDIQNFSELQANAFLSWIIKNVRSHKCTWCKGVINYIKRKLCDVAGSAICNLAATAFGPMQLVVKNFVCGAPINASQVFSYWCVRVYDIFAKHYKFQAHQLCGRVHIPTFALGGQKVALGYLC